jgi:V/A-type H+-transporting ATPase subunit A
LRQKFIDWNYTEFQSDAFYNTEAEINAFYNEKGGTIGAEAEMLLKGGE